jgi:hypothetical protein
MSADLTRRTTVRRVGPARSDPVQLPALPPVYGGLRQGDLPQPVGLGVEGTEVAFTVAGPITASSAFCRRQDRPAHLLTIPSGRVDLRRNTNPSRYGRALWRRTSRGLSWNVCKSADALSLSRATTATPKTCRSRRLLIAWVALRRRSRRTSMTRRARRRGRSRRATRGCAAAVVRTRSRETGRATLTRTARRATLARSSGAGRARGCSARCAGGAPATAGGRRPTTGHGRTRADVGERRSSD